ncbi:DUF859 family phage minor structural protein [Hominenteromicrobium sp.]|uniref:DUF859 family phage minor structural protein n=2 Tax=Hominenteromicrobium sp. TaxID=3073581 RepID=UPI003AF0593F
MGKNSYKAQLNYYDSKWGWKSEGTASQGQWNGTGVRTGVLYFPGLAALKGKIINSVKLTATTGQTGYGTATTKTVYIYNSASQGGIKTSLNAGHRTGNALGSCKAPMWDNTKTFDVAFMAASIAAGYDTYCIYNGSSYTDYLKWTAVTLEVDWQEPATQPSLSAATVEMGKSVTINTPAVNNTYRHTLRYAFGGASGTIATGIASSVSWTPPVSLANQIPSATAGSGTIYCDTYSGSTLLGTKSVSITLTVPGSVVPSAGTLSAALAEDTSGTGLYVKGMGKAKLTLSGASGAYGSSITSYTITGGGWAATNGALTTGTLASAGNITFTATVTDSRGRKASTTRTISVIDYTKPGVAVCDVYRCDADGNRKKAGTYFAVEINASYSAITGNTLSITVRYKKQSESNYGTAANVTNNGKTVIGSGNIGASTTYDVLVTVADKYNSLSIQRTLSTKSVLQSFKRSAGAAIGKVAELANWLDVAWDTRIRGNLQVDGTISSADQYRIKWQTIPDGADLNDETYKEPGYYRSIWGQNKIANMPPNFGTYGAFELTVTGISDAAYCTQRLKDISTNRSWVRTQTSWKTPWTWTDWEQVITTDTGNNFYARLQSPNNLIHDGNEFTFVSPAYKNARVWFNYRTASGNLDGDIGEYYFGNGKGGLAPIKASGIYADTLGWKTLWSGKLTSGSITITGAKKYAAILVSGHPGSEAYRTHICLPTGGIDGQMVTNMVYMYFVTTYSGDDCTITLKSNPSNGNIDYVWGIVQWKE